MTGVVLVVVWLAGILPAARVAHRADFLDAAAGDDPSMVAAGMFLAGLFALMWPVFAIPYVVTRVALRKADR